MRDSYELTKTEKFTNFIKANIMNFALILVCAVYIFKGMLEVHESGKTVAEIFADGAIAFTVSITIKTIFRKKGISNGFENPAFINTCNNYGSSIEKISKKIEYVDLFCKEENDERLKNKQKIYLLKNAISYEEFKSEKYCVKPKKIKNDKELNKREMEKYKICKKARKMKVFQYTSKLITNAYDSSSDEESLLKSSTKKFQKKASVENVLLGLLVGFIFGYYILKEGAISKSGMIWASLQIAIYLALGFIEYLNAYEFVTKTIREKIKRVLVIIDKFANKIPYYESKKILENSQLKKEEIKNELQS